MIRTECVFVTWDLNLWDTEPLALFLRTSRVGFLRLMSQRLVSFDGPNVNLAFLKKYASVREEKELDPLMDLDTCGLPVVHGSMKASTKVSK